MPGNRGVTPFLSRLMCMCTGYGATPAEETAPVRVESPAKGYVDNNPQRQAPKEDRVLSTMFPRLYPRWCVPTCGTYKSHTDTPNPTVEVAKECKETPPKRESNVREVRIDRSTSVPLELYWDLMKAGERAKRRGQHELRVADRLRDTKPVLVRRQRSAKGGEATLLLLEARDQPGCCGGHARNSYWVLTLFALHGRAVPWVPLTLYALYAAASCSVAMQEHLRADVEPLKQLSGVATMLGFALFMLLSFRNNSAFQRWQQGGDSFRTFCGLTRNQARYLLKSRHSLLQLGAPEEVAAEIRGKIGWLMACVESARQTLRGESDAAVMEGMVSPKDLNTLMGQRDKVLYCLLRANDFGGTFLDVRGGDTQMMASDSCYGAFGACASVLKNPMPFAHISHLRTFLVLWLACIPWVYLGAYGWFTIPLTMLIGYGIIGIEEAAVVVENPFGTDTNDIPMDAIAGDTLLALQDYADMVPRLVAEAAAAAAGGGGCGRTVAAQ